MIWTARLGRPTELLDLSALLRVLGSLPRLRSGLPIRKAGGLGGQPRRHKRIHSGDIRPGGPVPPVPRAGTAPTQREGPRYLFRQGACRPEPQEYPWAADVVDDRLQGILDCGEGRSLTGRVQYRHGVTATKPRLEHLAEASDLCSHSAVCASRMCCLIPMAGSSRTRRQFWHTASRKSGLLSNGARAAAAGGVRCEHPSNASRSGGTSRYGCSCCC